MSETPRAYCNYLDDLNEDKDIKKKIKKARSLLTALENAKKVNKAFEKKMKKAVA
jgi:hypothetical protein